ncbi:isopenicillin N synthase family oxygenase [Actinomadura viridis]|uniref:Isopenicillin N synthase-like dioxygenase n=1 Tax=Actinomadura viridis TaxID=58110 RepID=A0A931GKW2_9ACTN|nr:isopenicillin N synthase family oxygenase [Actinomadura viridis]MBG6090530.1 isopenicillin N synthase-like dioxygenase [Actinomadura viridis]
MTRPVSVENPVPLIDIGGFLAGTDLRTAPEQVGEAATTSGFFQIVGHGIPRALFDACYAAGEELGRLPEEAKRTLTSPSGHPYRGLRSNYDKSGWMCSEGFTVSRFDGPDDARAHGVSEEYAGFFVDNVWPDVPGFRPAVEALAARTRELGGRLMQIFALALDLPIDHFDACTAVDSTTSTIRLYPARHAPLDEDPTVIFDEHFDGGLLTMLHQRGTYEGLQIRNLDGEWFSVPVHPEAFVINMGELMTRWTNGNWPATRHRVIASSDPDGYRITLPTFYNAAPETVVSPLPSQGGLDRPLYEPVTVAEWEGRHITSTHREREHTISGEANEAYVARLAGADK